MSAQSVIVCVLPSAENALRIVWGLRPLPNERKENPRLEEGASSALSMKNEDAARISTAGTHFYSASTKPAAALMAGGNSLTERILRSR